MGQAPAKKPRQPTMNPNPILQALAQRQAPTTWPLHDVADDTMGTEQAVNTAFTPFLGKRGVNPNVNAL